MQYTVPQCTQSTGWLYRYGILGWCRYLINIACYAVQTSCVAQIHLGREIDGTNMCTRSTGWLYHDGILGWHRYLIKILLAVQFRRLASHKYIWTEKQMGNKRVRDQQDGALDLILENSRNIISVTVISLGVHAGWRMQHVSRMGSHVARIVLCLKAWERNVELYMYEPLYSCEQY